MALRRRQQEAKESGVVGKIDEEGIAFRQLFRHFVGEHGVFAFAAVGQHRGGYNREGQNGFGALLVKPFKEEVFATSPRLATLVC